MIKVHAMDKRKQEIIVFLVAVSLIIAMGAGYYARHTAVQRSIAVREAAQIEQQQKLEQEQQKQLAMELKLQEEAAKQAAEQKAITDAEQAKKSAQETQSAEDKAANRYSNTYGSSKVYEATCGGSQTSGRGELVLSYSRDTLNSGAPFTVTVTTPDGGPLGQVFVNTTGSFTANPRSFSSDGSSSSFTALFPPGYNAATSMGPSMDTGGAQGSIYVSASCGAKSYGAGIGLM